MDAYVRPVDLRRAVFALLLRHGKAMTVSELVDALVPELGAEQADRKRISDLLRHQVRLGHVRRLGRGVYQVVPGSLSRTTAWRCLNWRLERDRWRLPAERQAS